MSDEKTAYAKAYQAGRRFVVRESSADLQRWRKEQFRQQAALVALTQMMLPGNAWGTTANGVHKQYSTMEEYSKGAFKFADEMVKRTWFSDATFETREGEPT